MRGNIYTIRSITMTVCTMYPFSDPVDERASVKMIQLQKELGIYQRRFIVSKAEPYHHPLYQKQYPEASKGDVRDLSTDGSAYQQVTPRPWTPKSHTREFKYCACASRKIVTQKRANAS